MLTPRRLLYIATGGRLRRRIGVRITAGFAISALLTLLVAIISLYYNREAGRELARISERDRAISADFRQLVLAVEQQHGAVQSFLLSGDESVIGQVDAARQRFQQTLLRLEGALPEAERAGTFERIRAQADKLSEVATDDIGLYRQGWTATAYFLWRSDGTQARDTLTSTIDQQIATHNAAVDREINDSRDRLRATFAAAVLLVVLGAVTAFVIGVNLIRSVTEPVRALMSMVAGIRSGDLRSRAPVIGENELAELTRTMNAMAANLEHSRGELEKALTDTARSELRYRTITEQAKDIIFTVQPDGIINFVSPAVSTILGFAADDLVGKNVEMLYTSDTRSQMASYGPWDLPGPRPFAGVIELRTKDQRTIQLDINTTVLMEDGKLVAIHGIGRDVSERVRLEQELHRLHAQDRRRIGQLTTLNEVGSQIAALQPLDKLLPAIAQRIGESFAYEHVRVILLGEAGEAKAVIWRRQPAPQPLPLVLDGAVDAGAWKPLPGPTQGMVSVEAVDTDLEWPDGDEGDDDEVVSELVLRALSGERACVTDRGEMGDPDNCPCTEIAVPVRSGTKVLGVLDVRGSSSQQLDDSDVFTLQTLAGQIAVAIENVRLFESGQRLAVSEERNRLARDLHDSVTQELFSMTMIAGALPLLMERKPDAAKERLTRLHDLARGALTEMRALLFALRPAALAEEGLAEAIRKYAAAFEHREGIPVTVVVDSEVRLPAEMEEAFYRIVQEALTNVAKHSRAGEAVVRFAVEDGIAKLSVHDNGNGFDPAQAFHPRATTLGLTGIRERMALLGGAVHIDSRPGSGATLTVEAPLAQRRLAVS